MITVRHIHRYRLRLAEPLQRASTTMTHREGVLVGAVDSEGRKMIAEAAPLAPFTRETVEEVLEHFEAFEGKPLDWLESPLTFARHRESANWPPTIGCAWETLHASSLLARGAFPMRRKQIPVRIYGLATSPHAAQHLFEHGIHSLKIKTPQEDAGEIIAAVERYLDQLPGTVDLRIDANQRWSFETSKKVLPAIGELGVVCVEEPLANPTPDAIRELAAESSVPLFADESVRSVAQLGRWAGSFDGLVLKPMFAGGPFQALHLARHAAALGMACYVTTALDAAVGRRIAAWTAQMLPAGSGDLPHGLSTGAMLIEDVGPPMRFDEDRLQDDAFGSWQEFAQEVWKRCF